MKDLELDTGLEPVLQDWLSCKTEAVAATLHPDFSAFGVEEGLYIRADGATYLRFVDRMRPDRTARACLEWVDIRHRIAAACLSVQDSQILRFILLTLLLSDGGWRVVTATFLAEAQSVTGARQVPAQ